MAAENDRRQRADDNYKRLRKQLDERLKADEKLKKIAEKIKQGKADFKDTSEYSKIISEYLGKIISENIGEINNPMGKELVCKALLEDNYELINGVLGEVQASVDEKMGVQIKPQKAPFPAERVIKAAHSLEDKTVPVETIKRRAKSASTNVSMSFHDDYMKANADFRSNAGLTCYITRTDSGKCCDWCSKIAGRYVYGKEPADIFRRHDNCKCSVIYENGRQRQDVWTKRTWEQPANPEPYEPTVLSPDEAKEIQQRKLEEYKGLTKRQNSDIIETGRIRISMQFFANKNISKMSSTQLTKSIASWKKRIEEHEEKIAHPEKYYDKWDTYDEDRKNRLLHHWKHEVKTFDNDVNSAINELKKRGVEIE